jgi:hypothetical protein
VQSSVLAKSNAQSVICSFSAVMFMTPSAPELTAKLLVSELDQFGQFLSERRLEDLM